MTQKVKLLHPIIAIISTGFLLYGQSLFFDYSNFDDNVLILDNQAYISDFSNFFDAFKRTVFITGTDVFYRPIETIWFMLNAQVAGSDLFFYHFTSILLHCIATYLVYVLLKRLHNSEQTSFLLSLIFLVHPLGSQAVAWIPGVVDVLVAVFSISSFLFFLNFIENKKQKDFLLHILFFALALYTKEIAACIALVCVAYFLINKHKNGIHTRLIMFVVGWVSVGFIWFAMRQASLDGQNQKHIFEMVASVFVNIPSILQYLGKVFFPFNLSVMPVIADTHFTFGGLALIIIAYSLKSSSNKRKSMLLFASIWFIFFLLPTLIQTSVFRVHQSYEHRMYLPLVGVLLFIAEFDWMKFFSFSKVQHKAVSITVLMALFLITIIHSRSFANTYSFLKNAVATSPSSSLAHRNMGIYYQDVNQLKEASESYVLSLMLNPHEKDLHNNLGVIYDTWGKFDLAAKEFRMEVEMNPTNKQALHNLSLLNARKEKKGDGNKNLFLNEIANGRALMQQGKTKEAESLFVNILNHDSLNTQALFNLGILYYGFKQLDAAEALWRRAAEIDTTYTDAYSNLAISLAQQGKNKEAEIILKKVISSNPDFLDGYFNLANFYAKNNNEKEAIFYLTELKRRGVTKDQILKRGIKLSPELERVFK